MRMKTFLLIALILSFPMSAFSALPCIEGSDSCWVVRTDGGPYGTSSSSCNGHYDVAFTGSNGPNCAVQSLFEIHRYNNGFGSLIGNQRIQNGDTVLIGDPGSDPGEFLVGWNEDAIWPGCNTSGFGSRDCRLAFFEGIDSNNKMKLYGRGWDTGCSGKKVQLWGSGGTRFILTLNGNVDLRCVDLTDHSSCMGRGPGGVTVNGEPAACPGEDPARAFVEYAESGIEYYWSGNELHDVDIHGVGIWAATQAPFFDSWINDTLFENVRAFSNGGGFLTGPRTDNNGTIRFTNCVGNFNGCGEKYPLEEPLGSIANLHNCISQPQGGWAADGVGLGADGNSHLHGIWIIEDSDFSFNTHDGFDSIHTSQPGELYISRSRFEGNAGSAIKLGATKSRIFNNIIAGNCSWHYGRSFTATKNINGSNVAFNICRAGAPPLSFFYRFDTDIRAYNNTVLSNSYTIWEVNNGGTCGGTQKFDVQGNIFRGGYSANSALNGGFLQLTAYMTLSADPTCGGLTSNDYNLVYGTDEDTTGECTGSNSLCGVDPKFSGTIKVGGLSASDFYQGTDYVDQVYLQTSSPVIDAGNPLLDFEDYGSADYYGESRIGVIDIGAVESTLISACSAVNSTCNLGTQCCSALCCAGVCVSGSSCAPPPVNKRMNLQGLLDFGG